MTPLFVFTSSTFSSLSRSPTMECSHWHNSCWLWAQLNRNFRDLNAWLCSHFWINPRDHTYSSVYWDFQGPRQWPPSVILMMYLTLRVINILLCFPGRVRVLIITISATWIPWYGHRMMVRVVYLTWLFIMDMAWLFSSIRVIRWSNFSSRMVLYLTLAPWTMLSSRLYKLSWRAN